MSIGENIRKARREIKFTQKEFAKLIGKSERMVQKYEKDEVTPSIEMLNKMSIILGVSLLPIDKCDKGIDFGEHFSRFKLDENFMRNLIYSVETRNDPYKPPTCFPENHLNLMLEQIIFYVENLTTFYSSISDQLDICQSLLEKETDPIKRQALHKFANTCMNFTSEVFNIKKINKENK